MDTFRDGLNWHSTWDAYGINAVFLENYWNSGSPVAQSRYFDDFVIATSRIGLARTGLNPELIKTPFESDEGGVQTGFQLQIAAPEPRSARASGRPAANPAGAAHGEIVWDSGTIEGAGDRVRVDAVNGRFRGRLAGATELEPATLYEVRVRQRGSVGGWSAWSPWRAVIETAAAGHPDAGEEAGIKLPARRR